MEPKTNIKVRLAGSLFKILTMIFLFLLPAYITTTGQSDPDFREEPIEIETWMTAPFETGIAEEPLVLEAWMTAPFENHTYEEPMEIEAWMTVPFERESAYKPLEENRCNQMRDQEQLPFTEVKGCCS